MFAVAVLMTGCLGLTAQHEGPDTLTVSGPVTVADSLDVPSGQYRNTVKYNSSPATAPAHAHVVWNPEIQGISLVYRQPQAIAAWRGGEMTAYGQSAAMPGLMGMAEGTVSVSQQMGAFTLTAYGEAVKYGYYRGLDTSWGFGGSLTYTVNDKLSVTLFGNYSTPVGRLQPAMAGYANLPAFGGYVNYNFSSRWGVRAGVRSYRSMLNNHWETVPIVEPYYRINKNASIGVDVGGILYQILRASSGAFGPKNPTIGPPVP